MSQFKCSLEATIPTGQYANIRPTISGEVEDVGAFNEMAMPIIEGMFAKYGDKPLVKKEGIFERKETFTGEVVMYDSLHHKYKDLDGNPLISATTYKKKFEKPFELDKVAEMVSKKYGVPVEIIKDMWAKNSKISTTFGSAIHYAMEQYWLHRYDQCGDKEYHLPKHPLLRQAVESFPDADYPLGNVIPEIFVSNVKKGMVGQIDGLVLLDEEKKARIIDYKTDAELRPDKLKLHFIQLSFYADILKAFGWTIEGLEIWNYTSEWKVFESPVLDLEKLEAELTKKK